MLLQVGAKHSKVDSCPEVGELEFNTFIAILDDGIDGFELAKPYRSLAQKHGNAKFGECEVAVTDGQVAFEYGKNADAACKAFKEVQGLKGVKEVHFEKPGKSPSEEMQGVKWEGSEDEDKDEMKDEDKDFMKDEDKDEMKDEDKDFMKDEDKEMKD